jgi:hypothetical protein
LRRRRQIMSKVNVLFNTEKYYIDSILPNLKDKVSGVLFSSSSLMVYESDDLEIMVNNLGNVNISSTFSEGSDINILISKIFNEYNRLKGISELFNGSNDFKIVSPKEHTPKFVEHLVSMNYITNVIDTFDTDTVTVL